MAKNVSEMIAEVQANIERKEKLQGIFSQIMGSKATPPEGFYGAEGIRAEVINEPEVPEEVVRMLVLGAAFDEEHIKHLPEHDRGITKADYTVMNALASWNNSRNEKYQVAMRDARHNAAKALAQYKTGDNSLIDRYANNIKKYLETEALSHPTSEGNEGQTFYALFSLYNQVKDTAYFNRAKVNADTEKKLVEKELAGNLVVGAEGELLQFIKNYDELTKDANNVDNVNIKNDLIADILARYVINKFSYSYYDSDREKVEESLQGIINAEFTESEIKPFVYSNIDEEDKKLIDNMDIHILPAKLSFGVLLKAVGQSESIQTDLLVADGLLNQNYFSKVVEAVKKTEEYKNLIKEKDLEKIYSKITNLRNNTDLHINVANKNVPFSMKAIDLTPDQKEKDKEYTNNFKARCNELIPEYKENVKYKTLVSIKNTIKTAHQKDNVKTDEALRKAYQDCLTKMNINAGDLAASIDKEGNALNAGTELKTLADREVIYTQSRDKMSLYRFEIYYNQQHQPEIFGEKVDHVDYLGEHYSANYRLYDYNAELANNNKESISQVKCETIAFLPAYLNVMKKAGEKVNQATEYNNLIASMERVEAAFKAQYSQESYEFDGFTCERYRDITGEEFSALKEALSSCATNAKAYIDSNPYDSNAKKVLEIVTNDMELIQDLKLTEGKMPLAKAIYNKKRELDKRQEDPYQDAFNRAFGGTNTTSLRNMAVFNYLENSFSAYLEADPDIYRYPDGTAKEEDGCYFSKEGVKLDSQYKADYIKKHYYDIKNLLMEKYNESVKYTKAYSGDYDRAFVRETLKEINPNYRFFDDEQVADREKMAAAYDKMAYEAMLDIFLECNMSRWSRVPERDHQMLLDFSGTPEAREKNRQFQKLITSAKREERWKAYEMGLEILRGIKPEEYSIDKDSLLITEPKKLIGFIYSVSGIQQCLSDMKSDGFDIMDPKYDQLRNNYGTLEQLVTLWTNKLNIMCSPVYGMLDINQLWKADSEALSNAQDILEDELAGGEAGTPKHNSDRVTAMTFNDLKFAVENVKMGNNSLIPDKDNTSFAQRVKNARELLAGNPKIESEDRDVVNFIKEIKADNKLSRSSEEYKRVYNALNEYRETSMYLREEARDKVLDACYAYTGNKKHNRKRIEAVEEVRKYFVTLEKTTKGYMEQRERSMATRIADEYCSFMKGRSDNNWKNEAERAQAQQFLRDYAADSIRKIIIDEIMQTKVCKDMCRDPKLASDEHFKMSVQMAFAQRDANIRRGIVHEENPDWEIVNHNREDEVAFGREVISRYASSVINPAAESRKAKYDALKKVVVSSQRVDNSDAITTVILGSMIDTELINSCEFKAGISTEYDKKDYLFSKVFSSDEATDIDLEMAMLEARKRAKSAFEAYDAGNPEAVKRYAKNIVDYLEKMGKDHVTDHTREGQIFATLFDLYNKSKESNVFKDIKLSDEAKDKLEEGLFIAQQIRKIDKIDDDMAKDISAQSSVERARQLKEILTAYTIKNLDVDYNGKMVADTLAKAQEELASERYYDSFMTREYFENTFEGERFTAERKKQLYSEWTRAVSETKKSLDAEVKHKYVNYQTYMLSDPVRREKYLNALSSLIEETETYQSLLKETDGKKLKGELDKIDHSYENISKSNGFKLSLKDIDNVISEEDRKKVDEINRKLENIDVNKLREIFENRSKKRFADNVKTVLAEEKATAQIRKTLEDKNITIKNIDELYDAKGVLRKSGDLFAKPGSVLYALRKGEPGLVKLTVNNNQLQVDSQDYLPYDGITPIENRRLYAINNEAAGLRPVKLVDEECNVSYYFDKYLDIMQGAKREEPSGESYDKLIASMKKLNELVKAQYKKEKYVWEGTEKEHYRDIAPNEYIQILTAYVDCEESVNNYLQTIPYDNCAIALAEFIKTDRAIIEKLPLEEGGMPFATALANKDYLMNKNIAEYLQKSPVEVNKIHEVITSYTLSYINKLVPMYPFSNGEYKLYPDGTAKMEDGCLFDVNNVKVSNADRARSLDRAAFIKFVNDRIPNEALTGINSGEYTQANYFENIAEFIKSHYPGYELPSRDEMVRREAYSNTVLTKLKEVYAVNCMEQLLAGNGKQLPREYNSFLKISGSEEDRQYNSRLYGLATSDKKEDRLKAAEMVLDRFMELNLYDYNFEDPKLFTENLERAVLFVSMTADMTKFMESQKNKGIDIRDDKYAELRRKLPVLESMGYAISTKLQTIVHPLYKYADVEKMSKYPSGVHFANRGELDMESYGAMAFFNSLGMHFGTLEEAGNWVYGGKKPMSFEMKINKAYKVAPRISDIEEGDNIICKLRAAISEAIDNDTLTKNEKDSLIDFRNCVDAYRDSKMYDKEVYRSVIDGMCQGYLIDHKNDNSRLVDSVKALAPEIKKLQKITLKYRQERIEKATDAIFDSYVGRLEKLRNNNLAGICKKPEMQKAIKEKILKADYLEKVIRDAKYLDTNKIRIDERITNDIIKPMANNNNNVERANQNIQPVGEVAVEINH